MSAGKATTVNKKQKAINIDYENAANISDELVLEKMMTARVGLMIKKPFFGNLATRLRMVRADDWCPTAATDGRCFYYNAAFIDALTIKETEFLFGHEVLHLVFEHLLRRDHRDPQLHNIACDYAVNQILADEGVGEVIKTVPVLLDPKYKGLASEEIYALLEEDWEAGKQEIRDLIQEVLDEHDPWGDGEGEEGEDGEGKSKGKGDGTGRPGKLTAEEKKELKDELREAMKNASESAGAGNTPAGIQRMINDMYEDPKMDWRELIQQQLQSLVKSDFSFMRPSRKSPPGIMLPGMIPDVMIDVDIAIDMSGSISAKQAMFFLSEIAGIMEEFPEFRINVWCFDTKVYGFESFTEYTADEIYDYKPKGGGGTMFECNWEFMMEEGIEPKKLIVFTDGYPCGTWGDENYCDTIFIIHDAPDIEAPFGLTAHYTEGDA